MTREQDMLKSLNQRSIGISKTIEGLQRETLLLGKRIHVLEDDKMAMTLQITALFAHHHDRRELLTTNRALCDARRLQTIAAVTDVQRAIERVLESHTKSIHDNNLRLDQVSEQFAQAGFSPLALSNGEHVPHDDDPNPKPLVNPTKPIVDPATTNTRTSDGPRPTVPA